MAEPRDRNEPASPEQRTQGAWKPPLATMERPRGAEAPTKADGAPVQVQDGSLPLAVGSVIGQRYVIEQHISSGGFGAVYRAADQEIRHHQVALKLLHRPSASQAERESALRELMLIASVSHPSVVQFKDYGWYEGRLWFAMPWYRGQTLDRVLDGESGMTRAEARPIFTQILQALAAMHVVGVHHHDIKPENIFLADIAGFPEGLPVLLDLGIATQRGENPKGLTVEYASPETAAAMMGDTSKPIGSAADVFSLALVLRNALDPSVASPVRADDVIPALHQRATQLVPLPKRRDLRYLEPHFKRWLSLDPDERPSAAEFADELRILTQPEETRKARVRLAKRIAPVLVVAGLLITALVFQLRKQKTVLTEREKELTEERQAGEELRKQSEAQLNELEATSQTLGDERNKLTQALGVARKLSEQLTSATRRATTLDRKVDTLTKERDELTREKATLTAARDQLVQTEQRLSNERDALRSNLGRTTSERDEAARARDRLTGELERARTQREALDQRIASVTAERDRLTREQAQHQARYESAARKRDEAIADAAEQKQKVEKLEATRKKLEQRIDELEAKLSAQRAEDTPRPIKPIRVPLPKPKKP